MELVQIETVGELLDELLRINRALNDKYKEHARFYIDGEPALNGYSPFEKEKIVSVIALQFQESVRPLGHICTAEGLDFTFATINRFRSQVCLGNSMSGIEVDNLPIGDFVANLRSSSGKAAPVRNDTERAEKRECDSGPEAGPYSPKQAACRLGISASKVYDLCRKQILSHDRIGRRIIIRSEHLDEYQNQHSLHNQAPSPARGFRHL